MRLIKMQKHIMVVSFRNLLAIKIGNIKMDMEAEIAALKVSIEMATLMNSYNNIS